MWLRPRSAHWLHLFMIAFILQSLRQDWKKHASGVHMIILRMMDVKLKAKQPCWCGGKDQWNIDLLENLVYPRIICGNNNGNSKIVMEIAMFFIYWKFFSYFWHPYLFVHVATSKTFFEKHNRSSAIDLFLIMLWLVLCNKVFFIY